MTKQPRPAIAWWQAEPGRLARDRSEVERAFPDLAFTDPGPAGRAEQGGWSGLLPRWPFDRPEPAGLSALVGPNGLQLRVDYVPAYPMVMPLLWPLNPKPQFIEHTQSTWHVLPIGALCLLQSQAAWDPATSLVDLLLKAAGWRIEYALMKTGAIETMTTNGIVTDDRLDHLLCTSPLEPPRAFDDDDPQETCE